MERPKFNVNAATMGGAKAVKGRNEDTARPRRIVDIRFGQVQLVTWRGREYVEVT